uniref:Uncharacterized protein n=1 Tax=Rhizophora mucronata TaxID=61149 RepID=A0A2P2N5R4_RHIMU
MLSPLVNHTQLVNHFLLLVPNLWSRIFALPNFQVNKNDNNRKRQKKRGSWRLEKED